MVPVGMTEETPGTAGLLARPLMLAMILPVNHRHAYTYYHLHLLARIGTSNLTIFNIIIIHARMQGPEILGMSNCLVVFTFDGKREESSVKVRVLFSLFFKLP